MAKLIVTDMDGAEHEIEGEIGLSVMEVIRDSDVHINAICGGCCSCSTCHVHVDESWASKLEPASDEEKETLELTDEISDASRLGCQITFEEKLDGLRVKMTTDSND
jgi:2Fe-2S ferredoxin